MENGNGNTALAAPELTVHEIEYTEPAVTIRRLDDSTETVPAQPCRAYEIRRNGQRIHQTATPGEAVAFVRGYAESAAVHA